MKGVGKSGIGRAWLGAQGELCLKCDRSYTKSNLINLLSKEFKVDRSKVKKVNVLNRSSKGKSVIGKKTKGIGYKLFRVRLIKDAGSE